MTQRKRATGFALMDTAFAADPKFARLSRRSDTPQDYAAAVGVYWLLLADARRNRDRCVNWADFDEYPHEIAALKAVGLLSEDGFNGPSFDRWAPAYKSPWDTQRNATQGDAEVRKDTQATPTSALLNSPQLKSVPSPNEADGYIEACELLGYFPNSDDFRNEMTALDAEYGAEAVVAAVGQAFSDFVAEGTRPKPFDLKKAAHMILAEAKHRADKATSVQRAEDAQRRMADDIARQEQESWEKCASCGKYRRSHPTQGDHEFEVAA